jgi:hypothetical protein
MVNSAKEIAVPFRVRHECLRPSYAVSQMENKIRAVIKYELAAEIPLIE